LDITYLDFSKAFDMIILTTC